MAAANESRISDGPGVGMTKDQTHRIMEQPAEIRRWRPTWRADFPSLHAKNKGRREENETRDV